MYVLYSNHYIVELLVLFAKSFAIPKKFQSNWQGSWQGWREEGIGMGLKSFELTGIELNWLAVSWELFRLSMFIY